MKVAFFGGSFNPPHIGHVLAASYALSVGFDRVLAVVVGSHAFPKQLVSFEHRAAMAELAFSSLSGVEVSRIEASLPAPNYTLNTLTLLQREHPEWALRLLVGSDVMKDLERWHAFEEVEEIAPLYLLGRVGHSVPGTLELLPDISSTGVRGQLQSGEPDIAWLGQVVPQGVLRYIAEHELYGGEVDPNSL